MSKILLRRDYKPWPPIDKAMCRVAKAALAAFDHTKKMEVGILLTEDAVVRDLNRRYRQRDQATNVLSFAMEDGQEKPKKIKKHRLLGDVVLAYETVDREAKAYHISLEHHASHLVVHGVLHLLGYDHERSPAEARRQESKEIAILARLGIKDPYR
ncbi:MAG: rRNA maturation RNase YbeY [Magnetococcales bacterium]|nr:rRNA maturation RNase YbeY [Magnetococcales bacterium]